MNCRRGARICRRGVAAALARCEHGISPGTALHRIPVADSDKRKWARAPFTKLAHEPGIVGHNDITASAYGYWRWTLIPPRLQPNPSSRRRRDAHVVAISDRPVLQWILEKWLSRAKGEWLSSLHLPTACQIFVLSLNSYKLLLFSIDYTICRFRA